MAVNDYERNLGNYRQNQKKMTPEMERQARARVLARRKRKRRNRQILFAFLTVLLLALIGGIGYGVSAYKSGKAKDAAIKEGISYLEQGNYEAAIPAFDEAIKYSGGKVGKKEKDGLQYRAEAEYLLKDYEAALYTYTLLIEKDKDRDEYRRMAALCSLELGRFEEALAYEPLAARVYNRMALDFMEKEQYPEALEAIENGKAKQDQDVMADLSYNEVIAYEKSGDFKRALELLTVYAASYGSDENVERELTFLKTRQGQNGS